MTEPEPQHVSAQLTPELPTPPPPVPEPTFDPVPPPDEPPQADVVPPFRDGLPDNN